MKWTMNETKTVTVRFSARVNVPVSLMVRVPIDDGEATPEDSEIIACNLEPFASVTVEDVRESLGEDELEELDAAILKALAEQGDEP